jgi:L-fuculose-phosphate aldolase
VSAPVNETALRAEIARVGRLMHTHEYVDGTTGNISARLNAEHILATPSGLPKGWLEPEQLIVVNMRGEKVAGPPALKPTSELLMHLEAYRRRPDVNAVVHAHPIFAVALSIAGISLAECLIPEAVVILGLVPTTPYATPSSLENQRAISEVIRNHDALILQYHGTLTVGRDVTEAYLRLETLEHTAKIMTITRMLGGGAPLPPAQVTKLIQMRDDLGLARPGDAEEFCAYCGVCHAPAQPQRSTAPAPAASPPRDDNQLIREVAERVRRALHHA